MIVAHNLQAMNANRQFNIVGNKRSKSAEKLSSGYRVNRAADDAAGLAISEKMRRQIRGLTQASFNCQDGISMVQIADGALNEVHDMLQRGSELCVKAANGTLTEEDKGYIQLEIEQLKSEIDEIAQRTTFNERPVLQGSKSYTLTTDGNAEIKGGLPDYVTNASADLLAGHLTGTRTIGTSTYIAGTIDFSMINSGNIADLDGGGFNMSCATCNNRYSVEFISGAASSMVTSGQHYIYKISIDGVTDGTELVNRIISGTEGGHPNNHYTQLEATGGGKMTVYDNRTRLAGANKELYQNRSALVPGVAYAVGDADTSEESDVFIQAGAEANQHINIKLPNINSAILGIDSVDVRRDVEDAQIDSKSHGNGGDEGIEAFKGALSYVSRERSRMGAYQNRLEHTINNLNNIVENTTSAESVIRDTDMSKELVDYTQTGILAQAGQAMLTQANQSKQGVLELLG